MIGRELSHYRVLAELGAGGMGVVYEAEDTRLRRRVALKVLPEDAVANPSRLERFRREAQAASALNHPHICTIYDVGDDDGRPFIVMEKLEGESLEQLLRRGPLPPEQVVATGMQVADALAAAHAAGIVHRDVKPGNIFITTRGEAKLLDFGLARLGPLDTVAIDADASTIEQLSRLTATGTVLGTVSYMSPEQARGEKVDHRSDIFSFGAVMYEMATGRPPFRGPTLPLIIDSLLNRVPPAPVALNPMLPQALSQMIETTLEKDPRLRAQSAAELHAALLRLRGSESSSESKVHAQPPTRNRSWRMLAMAAALIVAGAVLLMIWMRNGDEPPASEIEPKANTSSAGTAAEDALLRGRYFMQREEIDQAIVAYEEVVALDPSRAAAWAELANAYATRTYFAGDLESERKAFVAVEKALAIDPNQAQAYLARGNLVWTRSNGFPHADALRDYRRAIDIDSTLVWAHASASRLLNHTGLEVEAGRALERALQLQPNNRLLRISKGWSHLYARDCEAALEELQRFHIEDALLVVALDCTGRTAEAIQLAEKWLRGNPDPTWESMIWAALALARARMNDRPGAAEAIGNAERTGAEASHFHHTAHLIAVTYAVLGETEASLDWLERTSREGFPCLATFQRDPDLAVVRTDERFERLEREILALQRELRAIYD